MSEAAVRAYWQRLWTEGDVEYAHEFYAPEFGQNGATRTPERLAAGARSFREHFADFSAEVLRVIPCEGGVVTRVRYRARHVGDFAGLPATGRECDLTGLDVFLFGADGKVVEHLHEADHELMWDQLGVPIPGG